MEEDPIEKAHTTLFGDELMASNIGPMETTEITKLIGLGLRRQLMERVSPHEYPFTYYKGENYDNISTP